LTGVDSQILFLAFLLTSDIDFCGRPTFWFFSEGLEFSLNLGAEFLDLG
jgi:hypothetical protein